MPFTRVQTAWHSRFDAQPFRILLLRRLSLQLPSSVRNCLCGLPLDSRGHHRAACATRGSRVGVVLHWRVRQHASRRGGRQGVSQCPCKGLGWTIAGDCRRWFAALHGAQLAVDTTIVSRCATVDGAPWEASRRTLRGQPAQGSHATQLTGRNGRTKFVVFGSVGGGRRSGEVQEFFRSLAKAKARSERAHLRCLSAQESRVLMGPFRPPLR